MPQRRFPRPWRFEPIPGGYRVIDANGLALAHVYGQPPDAVAPALIVIHLFLPVEGKEERRLSGYFCSSVQIAV